MLLEGAAAAHLSEAMCSPLNSARSDAALQGG